MIFDRWYTWGGETRESWRFKITKHDNEIPDAAGIYIMVRRTFFMFLKPVYIGKASNLQSRLIGHERWAEARKRGASERHYLCVRSESKRQRIEEDLIRKHRPKLNRIHMPADKDDAPNHQDLKRGWMGPTEYWGLNQAPKKPKTEKDNKTYWFRKRAA